MSQVVHVIVKGKKKKVRGVNLKLSKMGITDISQIEGLESLTFLKRLMLRENFITEIKGLESLVNLTHLFLSGNKITEIKGLENLKELGYLSLSNNNISEIKGLDNLKDLWTLDLRSNNISEIKGLENLTNLMMLYLDNNNFTDIKGLENLGKLSEITLGLAREPHWGFTTIGFNLNGKIIPWDIAKKMGIKYRRGGKFDKPRLFIRQKKMVKYCKFVKDTGYVDFTAPGIVDAYNEWEKYH